MTILDITYYIIIIINFVISIIFKRLWKQLYYVYFSVIIISEILVLIFPDAQKIYNLLDIFSILFFWFIFQEKLKNKTWIAIISSITIILSTFLLLKSKTLYSIYTGIISCLYVISISLNWFYEKIIENKNNSILKDQLFWISSSLLFWSIFYLFRMTPMYWIQTEDGDFLIVLKYIFQVATILSYILFLKGLLSKQS